MPEARVLHFILITMGVYQEDFKRRQLYYLIYNFESHSDCLFGKDLEGKWSGQKLPVIRSLLPITKARDHDGLDWVTMKIDFRHILEIVDRSCGWIACGWEGK